jgi:hypothetical protein
MSLMLLSRHFLIQCTHLRFHPSHDGTSFSLAPFYIGDLGLATTKKSDVGTMLFE